MMPVHESTLALSVYNAIRFGGSMSSAQALTHLQERWAPEMTIEEVATGVSYLEERGLIVSADGTLRAAHVRGSSPWPLKRLESNPTELVLK